MNYTSKYNMPKQWRAVTRTKMPLNRNARIYAVTPEVGKPRHLSVPLLYLIKHMLNSPSIVSKIAKKYLFEKNVKINNKQTHGKELVCINDIITIADKSYLFLLKTINGIFSYVLHPLKERPRFIVKKIDDSTYAELNGQRICSIKTLHVGQTMIEKSVVHIDEHTGLIPLIGKNKFIHCMITSFLKIGENYTVQGTYQDKNYTFKFNLEDIEKRRILLTNYNSL